jgi:cell division protein FtsW (lipid II flippase)
MGLTYVSAAVRDAQRRTDTSRRLSERHLVLVITSVVAALAIALSYNGRLEAQQHAAASQQAVRPLNLNTVPDSRQLEPLFAPIFTNAVDRRFAAERVLELILSVRSAGGSLPNVGALLRTTTSADAIQRASVVEYKERLRQAREKAAATGASPPVSLPVLTSNDLALLKPSVVVRTNAALNRLTLTWAVIYLASIWAVPIFWWARGFRGDYLLLAAIHLLTALGFAVLLSRQDPLRDTLLFIRYTQGVSIGLIAFAALSVLDFRKAAFLTLSYAPLVAALFLSALLIVFGDGPGGSNAKVNLGPVQPIEAIRLLLALFLAGYFARRWELLRQVRARTIRDVRIPGWLDLPKMDYVLPVLAGVAAALVFFFLQKDLGPALLISCVFLAMYAIARNRAGMAILGLSVLVAGFYLGYKLNVSTTLAARVQIWQSPWDNGVRGGDQIAQAIWAVSTGGLFGTGLGLGNARYLPAGHTDLVLAALGEELGFIGLLCVACVFIIIAARGFAAAFRADSDYGFFLATAVTLFLALPVLIMSAGMLGVVPLTGVVTPFLSYGGSAMVANFAALGVLTALSRRSGGLSAAKADIGSHSQSSTAAIPFRTATKSLIALLGIGTVGVLAALVSIQVLRSDSYVVRPHLGVQSDEVRRFQYNQRVLDVAAMIPRGTVYDRRGLPLATSDRTVARRVRDEYRKHGVDGPGCAAHSDERCYPLGGAAFHLLGDAASRRNWTATNTSYVERDAQDHLRGFQDRATAVKTTDQSGRSLVTIRRDYRELIPLLRHRYEADHPDVKKFLNRKRDITVTIDAPLQAQVASILSKYAARSATGHAAAIVLNPDNGHLLAIGSYPFPGANGDHSGEMGSDPEMLLDRARYGLYPPGSTFKLVTAVAALRRDVASSRATFTCTRQPNGRVGMKIPGWGVVRDDVLDAHPHGTIGMHEGIVRSCNAYFAQLAVRIGPQQILDTATMLGISVARDDSTVRLRQTLPQAGYGQGDVVATPLRMARVAGAIASKGILREPQLESGVPQSESQRLLTADAATLLGQYLRDAVLNGTGRSLRGHQWRIAGKTGTAEISGSQSHAWFTGFAPHGAAEKRIAFAVIIENAGYGGLAAAPAAGEIVSAAAASGLIR